VVKRMNMSLPQETMNQTDLPDPVKEDIVALQESNTALINRLLELEDTIRLMKAEKVSQ